MTRSEKIDLYGAGGEKLKAFMRDVPEEVMNFKPSPRAWSVREIIHHLADSEAACFYRCRKIIAESGTEVCVYDQDVWAVNLKYQQRELKDVLELFSLMRKYTASLLGTVDERVWEENYVMHPDDGRLTLPRWLDIYTEHVDNHIGQIKRNIAAWDKAGRPVG